MPETLEESRPVSNVTQAIQGGAIEPERNGDGRPGRMRAHFHARQRSTGAPPLIDGVPGSINVNPVDTTAETVTLLKDAHFLRCGFTCAQRNRVTAEDRRKEDDRELSGSTGSSRPTVKTGFITKTVILLQIERSEASAGLHQ